MIIPDIGFVYRLVSQYGQPHRAFHTGEHLTALFQFLKEFSESPEVVEENRLDLELMFWCIVFHDWIYVPGSPDNESLSAAAAVDFLQEYPKKDMVYDIIQATRVHAKVEDLSTELGYHMGLMIDIDLAGLGNPSEEYARTDAQIAQEFLPVFGESGYKHGRKSWCIQMADRIRREGIYNHPFFQGRNAQALINLEPES